MKPTSRERLKARSLEIAALTRQGQWQRALIRFQDVRHWTQPDAILYTTALKSFTTRWRKALILLLEAKSGQARLFTSRHT